MNNKRKPRQQPQKQTEFLGFLQKTFKILENPEYQDMIQWNEDGTTFKVLKPNEFSENVLPKYFKTNKFSSFVRQLNMYDFHKISKMHDTDENEWKHPSFIKGRPDLLSEIKRKISDKNHGAKQNDEQGMQLVQQDYKDNPQVKIMYKEIDKLTNKIEVLEKAFQILMTQNNQILAENKILWNEMVKNKDAHDRKLEKFISIIFSFLGKGKNFNLRNLINGGSFVDQDDQFSISDKRLTTKSALKEKEQEKMLKKLLKGITNSGNDQYDTFIDKYHQDNTDLLQNLQMCLQEQQKQGINQKRRRESFDMNFPQKTQKKIKGQGALIDAMQKSDMNKMLFNDENKMKYFQNGQQQKNEPLMITDKNYKQSEKKFLNDIMQNSKQQQSSPSQILKKQNSMKNSVHIQDESNLNNSNILNQSLKFDENNHNHHNNNNHNSDEYLSGQHLEFSPIRKANSIKYEPEEEISQIHFNNMQDLKQDNHHHENNNQNNQQMLFKENNSGFLSEIPHSQNETNNHHHHPQIKEEANQDYVKDFILDNIHNDSLQGLYLSRNPSLNLENQEQQQQHQQLQQQQQQQQQYLKGKPKTMHQQSPMVKREQEELEEEKNQDMQIRKGRNTKQQQQKQNMNKRGMSIEKKSQNMKLQQQQQQQQLMNNGGYNNQQQHQFNNGNQGHMNVNNNSNNNNHSHQQHHHQNGHQNQQQQQHQQQDDVHKYLNESIHDERIAHSLENSFFD